MTLVWGFLACKISPKLVGEFGLNLHICYITLRHELGFHDLALIFMVIVCVCVGGGYLSGTYYYILFYNNGF